MNPTTRHPRARSLTRCLVTAFSMVALWPVLARAQSFVLPDADSTVYMTHALVAEEEVLVGSTAQVVGSVHANDVVEVQVDAVVTGDATAVDRVRSEGTVSGARTSYAPFVVVPSPYDEAVARSFADRVFEEGQIYENDAVIDGVLFVAGDVVFRAGVSGYGTVLATGDVVFEHVVDDLLLSDPVESDALAVVAQGQVVIEEGRHVRGVLVAGDSVTLEEGVVLEGAALARVSVWVEENVTVIHTIFE